MENKGQGIFYGVIGVATLIVAIIGATFAFFAASANNATAVNGTTASASLTLRVERVAPTTAGNMVPQLSQTLGAAITGTDDASCIDGNGNTVCHVYEIEVTNGGSSTVVVDGTLDLTTTIANLKWYKINTATSDPSLAANGGNATSVKSLVTNVSLDANASETFYVVIWDMETGSDQTTPDANNSFTGTVTFTGAGGGVTSTFTV